MLEGIPWLPPVYKNAGYRVDPRVQWWKNKRQAIEAARAIHWALTSIVPVHTRFQQGYALSCSLGTGGLSKIDYAKLLEDFHAPS